MTRLCASVLLLVGAVEGQTLIPNFDREEVNPAGTYSWSGPFLLGIDKNPSSSPLIWTLDRTGAKEIIWFPMAGQEAVHVRSAAATADGTIVLVGQAYGPHGAQTGFIATIQRDRNKVGIVKDPALTPSLVTVSQDGVVWVIGREIPKGKIYSQLVLKRYSPKGKALTSGSLLVDLHEYFSLLRPAKDRVALLTEKAYTEFSLDGTVIASFPAPPSARRLQVFELAIRDDLQVIAQELREDHTLWALDRKKKLWYPLDSEPIEKQPRFLGFDGDQLVVFGLAENRGTVVSHYLLIPDQN
jgi:hypothetical protein